MAAIAVASAGMAAVTTATKLIEALAAVPDLLLDETHAGEREHAREALAELTSMRGRPSVLAVVGGGGSGKSSVVNAIVGHDIAAVSPIRPTTTGILVVGRGDVAPLEGAVEFVLHDRVPAGVLVVDTPSWDIERDAVRAAIARAHTVVVVLTPARYADAATAELVAGLPESANVVFVANRMPVDPDDADDVLDDIEAVFGVNVWAHVMEGETISVPESLLSEIPVDTESLAKRVTLAKEAANAGRKIARSVTAAASELSKVNGVLSDAKVPSFQVSAGRGGDWPAARDWLGAGVAGAMSSFDTRIVDDSQVPLAARIAESLPAPDLATFQAELDAWQVDTARTFRRRSEPKWRRASTLGLVERWSWVACIDTDAVPPRRVIKSMRGAFEATVMEARSNLATIVDSEVQTRSELWHETVSAIGEYRPGALLAASDALDGGERSDG